MSPSGGPKEPEAKRPRLDTHPPKRPPPDLGSSRVPRQGGPLNAEGKATGALPRPRPLQLAPDRASASQQDGPATAVAPRAATPKPMAAPPQQGAHVAN
eukprot:10862354-Karenia_brevis.AAC.1